MRTAEMRMSLSKRDKILLGILLIAIVAFAYYHFIYDPITKQIEEKKSHYEELEYEISVASAQETALSSTMISEDVLLSKIESIISSYYPYLQPQYFVDLVRTFSDEHGLILSNVDVGSPSYQSLPKIGKIIKSSDDPFLSAISELDKLTSELSKKSEPATESTPSADNGSSQKSKSPQESESTQEQPGSLRVNHLSFSLNGGNLEQYLGFLDSLNNTGYPIYISQYELENSAFDNTLGLFVSIIVIHLDRLTSLQYATDAAQFTFDKLPPAGSKNNFN